MIVLDEHLDDGLVLVPLSYRLKSRVVSVRELRPGTVIKDEAIPTVLGRYKNATFVTGNVSDFWRKIQSPCCVIRHQEISAAAGPLGHGVLEQSVGHVHCWTEEPVASGDLMDDELAMVKYELQFQRGEEHARLALMPLEDHRFSDPLVEGAVRGSNDFE